MKDNKNKNGLKRLPRFILCIALTLAVAISPVLPQINNANYVLADENSSSDSSLQTTELSTESQTEAAVSKDEQSSEVKKEESSGISGSEEEDSSKETAASEEETSKENSLKDSAKDESSEEITEETTEEATSESQTEEVQAKNILKADNSAQIKAEEEKDKELSPKLFAEFTAKTDFEEGINAKIEVYEKGTQLDVLKESLNKKLQKENKEIKTVDLALKMGFVDEEQKETEKNETIKVKLESEDESIFEDLEKLNDQGKLSLYHQKTKEDKVTKEWEKLAFKVVPKTDDEKAYIEFETESMSPFFFVQTKEREVANPAANEAVVNANEAMVSVNDQTAVSIDKFTVTLSSGATKTNGKWVWTPSSYTNKNTFYYDVNYAISGALSLKKGQFKIELPLHILKDRDGNWADEFDCPFISDSEYQEGYEVDFIYSIDEENNKVTITNIAEMSSGLTGIIEISYKSTAYTDDYIDMAAQNRQPASLIVMSEDAASVVAQKDITEDAVYIDTNAAVSKVSKSASSSSYYETWQDSWGTKPSGADNYYYVVWSVCTYFSPSTQAYDIKIEDTFSDMSGSVVGYKMQGESQFTSKNTQTGCLAHKTLNSSGNYRTDYVLTRYSKSQADTAYNKGSYTLSNKVKVTVTPAEKLDKQTQQTATGSLIRNKPSPTPPVVYTYYGLGSPYITCSRKYWNETDNWWPYYYNGNRKTQYTLDDFVNGELQDFEPDFDTQSSHSFVYSANGLCWDMNASGTEQDAQNAKFGHVYNDYEMQTKGFYIRNDQNGYYGSGNSLYSSDYDIASVYLSFSADKLDYYNKETKSFVTQRIESFTDSDNLTISVEYNGAWKQAAVYSPKTKEFTSVDETLITDTDSLKNISFADGVKNVKLEWSNPYLRSYVSIIPKIKLHKNEHVLNIIGNSDEVYVGYDCYGDINHAKSSYRGSRFYYAEYYKHSHGVRWIKDKKVFSNGSMYKSVSQVVNSKIERNFKIRWSLSFTNESWSLLSGREKGQIEQSSGTFYDLLPAGAFLDQSSISVTADGKALNKGSYTLSMIENYKNTGRTLLVFKIAQSFSKGCYINYLTNYPYESVQDYGKSLLGSAAYETGNSSLLNGIADTGGKITESALLSGLDSSSSGNKFLYDEARTNVEALFYQYNGLKKQVKAQNDLDYSSETTAYAGNSYSYKIRSANNKTNKAKNMIFFDSLESFYQSESQTEEVMKSDYKGTLKSVDVSQLQAMGVAPVVYLSATKSLNVAAHRNLTEKDANGENIWLEQSAFIAKYGSIEKATAVAVDARKAADGSDFVLDVSKGLTIILNMTAPKSADNDSEDPCAYNNVFCSLDLMQKEGESWVTQSQFVHYDYTTLHLRVVGDVSLKKVDETDKETPVSGATYVLTGTSDYNTEYQETRVTAQNGSFIFENIEKGTYELVETACSDDWQLDKNTYTVKIDSLGNASIEGMEKNEDGVYLAQDAPRIHTDINFKKADSITKNVFNGAEFILSGTSDYGNEILMQAKSEGTDLAGGEAGEVLFENVELGTYTISETKTKDGYILSRNTWKVRVTEEAQFFIYDEELNEAERNEDSYYLVLNEPLHSFRFVKSSTYGENIFLEGAKFSLTGISDYGTSTEKQAASDADGIVTFDGLEPGTYQLKETEAPEKHDLNRQVCEVTVKSDGTFEIDGLETTEISGTELYDFKDVKTEGVVKLTKIWKDTKTNDEREVPVITISTKKPSKSALGYTITFDADGGTFASTGKTTNEMLYSPSGTLLSGTYMKPESSEGDFQGWLTKDGAEFKVKDDGSPSETLTEDVTVYANYQKPTGMKYAVSVYGIGVDTLEEGTAGLTFGPAWGGNYVAAEKTAHTPTGTTSSNHAHRCIHNDSWATIIANNKLDPYIYEQCIAAACTKSIELSKNNTTTILNSSFTAEVTGDGPSALYYELLYVTTGEAGNVTATSYENLRWHPNGGVYGTNSGGWGATRIRAMLNGADSLTDKENSSYSGYATSDINQKASVYTTTNCLLATFPKELQNAIGKKAVKYDSVYNDTSGNNQTSYDKLWLFSCQEMGLTNYRPNEGSTYTRYGGTSKPSYVPYQVSQTTGSATGASAWAWLRSPITYGSNRAYRVGGGGSLYYYYTYYSIGVSCGFTLKR